jgi:ABC-type uncharacterized transport system permease subunit
MNTGCDDVVTGRRPRCLSGILLLLVLLPISCRTASGEAIEAMFAGSVGSPDALLSGTLVRATPLILTGLAVAIAFQGGVFNIGAEGQLLSGAAAAAAIGAWVGAAPHGVGITGMLAGGAVAGAGVAGIAAWLRLRFGVLDVISTLLLNSLAAHMVGYLVRGPMQESTGIYPQSETLAATLHLPPIISGHRLHVGFLMAVALCLATGWIIRHTTWGFALRATGANPRAASVSGRVNVGRVSALAFLASGALAGLAGAIEVSGVTLALYENLSPGYGFTAIAVALMAGLNPLWVIGTGLLFGALETGGVAMQRDAGVPSVLVAVVEGVIILALVAARGVRSPSSTGNPTLTTPDAGAPAQA